MVSWEGNVDCYNRKMIPPFAIFLTSGSLKAFIKARKDLPTSFQTRPMSLFSLTFHGPNWSTLPRSWRERPAGSRTSTVSWHPPEGPLRTRMASSLVSLCRHTLASPSSTGHPSRLPEAQMGAYHSPCLQPFSSSLPSSGQGRPPGCGSPLLW